MKLTFSLITIKNEIDFANRKLIASCFPVLGQHFFHVVLCRLIALVANTLARKKLKKYMVIEVL